MKTVSERLRELIDQSGLSSYRLAQLSGVPESALSRFLRRERTITLDTVDRLCVALRLELRRVRPRRKSKPKKETPTIRRHK